MYGHRSRFWATWKVFVRSLRPQRLPTTCPVVRSCSLLDPPTHPPHPTHPPTHPLTHPPTQFTHSPKHSLTQALRRPCQPGPPVWSPKRNVATQYSGRPLKSRSCKSTLVLRGPNMTIKLSPSSWAHRAPNRVDQLSIKKTTFLALRPETLNPSEEGARISPCAKSSQGVHGMRRLQGGGGGLRRSRKPDPKTNPPSTESQIHQHPWARGEVGRFRV